MWEYRLLLRFSSLSFSLSLSFSFSRLRSFSFSLARAIFSHFLFVRLFFLLLRTRDHTRAFSDRFFQCRRLLHSALTALLLPPPTSQCAIIHQGAAVDGEALLPFPLLLSLSPDVSVPLFREKCQLKSNRKSARAGERESMVLEFFIESVSFDQHVHWSSFSSNQ